MTDKEKIHLISKIIRKPYNETEIYFNIKSMRLYEIEVYIWELCSKLNEIYELITEKEEEQYDN